MAFLKLESGPDTGEAYPLDRSKLVVGRHTSCDLVLNHPTVSREHFFIERHAEKYLAVDNESGNGTYVNGERVTWIELKDGDSIQAGPFRLSFGLSPDEPQARVAAPRDGNDEDADSAMRSAEKTHSLYPREYLEGIRLFNAARYYDAHEVWEEAWLRSSGEAKLFYQMLIQAAVGLHHYERGNVRGARGMYRKVIEKVAQLPAVLMSLDISEFSREFRQFFAKLIEEGDEAAPAADTPRPRIRLLAFDAQI
ncbi:MAG TPA: DUF309 domain-containing protein [Blastocatellia bacterium]|nr:DUF309 domain-containing protein [Blastocatellia bacterium]